MRTDSDNLENLDQAELNRLKAILDIRNMQDTGLTWYEKTIKKKIIPIFLPFLTLLITIVFFGINMYEGEKAKAIDRYKSEVDMVKLVWNDISDNNPDSAKYKSAADFLLGMLTANLENYKKDTRYLGITIDERPIKIVSNANPNLREAYASIVKNGRMYDAIAKATDQKPDERPEPSNTGNSIVGDKNPEVVKAVDNIAGNQLRVYIQYRDLADAERVRNLADALKSDYVIPPIDHVANARYRNEIRYYKPEDAAQAEKLAARIKEVTGTDFDLKNINNRRIQNTMEVWYDRAVEADAKR